MKKAIILMLVVVFICACGGGGGGGVSGGDNGDAAENEQDVVNPGGGETDTSQNGDSDTPPNDNQANTETVIVFNDNTGDVYSTDLSGSNIRLLTGMFPSRSYPHNLIPFSLSPDGKHVACMIHRGAYNREVGDTILIASLIDPEFEVLINLPSYYRILDELWWSPDSNGVLICATYWPVDVSQLRESIRIYLLNENQEITIGEFSGQDYSLLYYPQWSPDSSRFYYFLSQPASHSEELIISLADGSDEMIVAGGINEEVDVFASHYATGWRAWAPDGSKLAFFATAAPYPAVYNLYIASNDGSNRILLAYNMPCEYDLTWSPDGKYISFNSYDRNDVIRIIASDGSNELQLPRYLDFRWTPQSKFISFDENRGEIIVADPESQSDIRIPAGMGSDGRLSDFKVSPDGNFIAYSFTLSEEDENHNHRRELFTVRTDGTYHTNISSNVARHYAYDYKWAPNSNRLAFAELENIMLPFSIYTISPDGSNKILVIQGEEKISIDEYKWTSDSQYIIFLKEYPRIEWGIDEARHLFSVNADGSEAPIQITEPTPGIDHKHVWNFDLK